MHMISYFEVDFYTNCEILLMRINIEGRRQISNSVEKRYKYYLLKNNKCANNSIVY